MSVQLLNLSAGALFFGHDRPATNNPRRGLREKLSRMTPRNRAAILELAQRLGAVELAAKIQESSAWKL